ncbi:dynamin family protein [Variovorax sp. dw_954]|uniref:dynamin family protein n=1 Tax=Variovorax sp. dw_954 TaxID=2720078 RepID=UPI001BD39203|nr:dynamin family protein [Variovorax sp. dw_954]
MTAFSPLHLRQNILAAKAEIESVCQLLLANEKERHLALSYECVRTATQLKDLIDKQVVPSEYRVAVVGRFKAGKSSFVNELLGRKLAGEETNPETAAVTTFRYGPSVRARVYFLSREQWQSLKLLHKDNPKDLEAHRITNWLRFPTRKPDVGADKPEVFDEARLTGLEREYLADGGKFVDLVVSDLNDRRAVIAFRKELKQFTTGSRPHHCLVERIEITAPSPLLEQGILLIDTPGLGDTERFRVALTEEIVKDVDAVLFLTKSGPAFDQSEKDFLLSLLRRGTVKQLVFVVTQVDQTYEQHVNAAKSDDEDPEPIQMRIERERRRLRAELDSTLTALGQGSEDSPALERYREQLGEIELVFTSAINHRKATGGELVHFPLHPTDPGGMLDMQDRLMQILSSESRLAHVARALRSGASSEIEQMLRVIEARRAAVQSVNNREVAEQKLGDFRRLFGEAGDAFSRTVKADAELLKRSVDGGVKLAEARIDAIVMSADKVLGDFESDDAGRHWRTRRSGTWGYMHGLQTKVANSIFPRVAGLLGEQQAEFANFVEKFDAHLGGLADSSARISEQLDVGSEIRVDVAARLQDFLTRSLEALQGLIEAEEAKIIQLLEDFVTDDVSERISSARSAVAGVWGAGTTIGQTREVKAFYAQVRAILATALEGYLRAKHHEHGEILIGRANELPDKALSEVKAELERIGKDITAAVEAASSGQKVSFEKLAADLANALKEASENIARLFGDEPEVVSQPTQIAMSDLVTMTTSPVLVTAERPPALQPAPVTTVGALAAPDWDRIQEAASLVLQQFRLQPEESNWGWGKIFDAKHLGGATHALLIDPYIDLPHQRRNLQEVVQWLCDTGPVKTIRVITGHRDELETAEGDQQLRLIAEQLSGRGVDLNWERDRNEHDRFLMLDNGIVFRLGKGLDIYRATQGLAVNNPIYRRIKSRTTIDVMGPRPS